MKRKKISQAILKALEGGGLSLNMSASDMVWSLSPDSAFRAHRFQSFQLKLPFLWSKVPTAVRFLLCLLGYDAITTQSDLVALTQAITPSQKKSSISRLSWLNANSSGTRSDSRILSARTTLCMRSLTEPIDWPAELSKLESTLAGSYPWGAPSPPSKPLVEVLLDASAWLHFHLSSSLFTHIAKALDIPPLPDHVWARLNNPSAGSLDQTRDESTDHVVAIAIEKMFEPEQSSDNTIPMATIDLLKSLFSVGKDDAGIRLADHLGRAMTQTKLSLAATAISSEGWLSGMLASWCLHLINHGSIRLENPSMATLAAYTSELLEPFASEMQRIDKTPRQMQQDDWTELFERLGRQTSTPAGVAALRSLHLWAVQTFGCEPQPSVIFRHDEVLSSVKSNIVWPHEQKTALDLIVSSSMDERTRHQILVMLALGISGLFRIGDLASLCVNDIDETVEGIRVTVDPSRGSHGGKSRAARRVVFLSSKLLGQVVLNFKNRRIKESCSNPDEAVYLFGDPNQPGRLYRYGHCIGLVNQLLKHSTGDINVSFHTLRHTSATARGLDLLLAPAADYAIAPLHHLLHQMAHAGQNTFWSVYFHAADIAIRSQIDRSPIVRNVSAEEASFWLNTTSVALRQRQHRAAHSDEDFYFQLLEQEAFGHVVLSSAIFRCDSLKVQNPTGSNEHLEFSFPWTYKALHALQEQPDLDALTSRLSCSADHIKQLCLAIDACARRLYRGRHRLRAKPLLDTASFEFCVDQARRTLSELQWSFDIPQGSSLKSVIKHLTVYGRGAEAKAAAIAWERMYVNQALTLENNVAPQPLLSLLAAASFPTHSLVVRSQAPIDNLSVTQRAHHLKMECDVVQPLFQQAMSGEVRVELVKPRRGHPTRYLMVRNSFIPPAGMAPAAGFRMAQFHGSMFSLMVLHHLFQYEK